MPPLSTKRSITNTGYRVNREFYKENMSKKYETSKFVVIDTVVMCITLCLWKCGKVCLQFVGNLFSINCE